MTPHTLASSLEGLDGFLGSLSTPGAVAVAVAALALVIAGVAAGLALRTVQIRRVRTRHDVVQRRLDNAHSALRLQWLRLRDLQLLQANLGLDAPAEVTPALANEVPEVPCAILTKLGTAIVQTLPIVGSTAQACCPMHELYTDYESDVRRLGRDDLLARWHGGRHSELMLALDELHDMLLQRWMRSAQRRAAVQDVVRDAAAEIQVPLDGLLRRDELQQALDLRRVPREMVDAQAVPMVREAIALSRLLLVGAVPPVVAAADGVRPSANDANDADGVIGVNGLNGVERVKGPAAHLASSASAQPAAHRGRRVKNKRHGGRR